MLNGVEVPQFLTLRTFLMKSLGACASVAASLPLGYQGVLLHIGGMVAGILASWLPHFDLTAGAKRAARAERGLGRTVSAGSAGTEAAGGRRAARSGSGARGGRSLNYSMSKVRPSPVFAEYEDDDESAFPTSQWLRKLPRIVEGLTRRLPGAPLNPAWTKDKLASAPQRASTAGIGTPTGGSSCLHLQNR